MYTVIMHWKNIGYHDRSKENEHLFLYWAYLEGKFFIMYVHALFARANDAKIVHSRDVKCDTEEPP